VGRILALPAGMSAPLRPRRSSTCRSLLALAASFGLLAGPSLAAEEAQPNDPSPSSAAAATTPAPLHIVVNIPAFRLDVYEQEALEVSYPVTVGKPREPTPTGHFELQRVVWNPWWHPLRKRKASDRVTPPGPRNPMGKVKLYFASLYYLHGTPKEKEIGTPASLGCVRLRNQDAIALALLVHRHAVAPLPPGTLEQLASARHWRTRVYPLQNPVPVHVAYDLAEVRGGQLAVYRDLYRLASAPLAELAARALESAGYPRERIDVATLERRVGLAPEGFRLPVEDLLLEQGAAATATAAAGAPSSLD